MTNLSKGHMRQNLVGQFLLTLVAFAMLGVLQCVVAATGSLQASLAVYKSSHHAYDALILEFSLTNHGSEPVQVLPWNTPLEEEFKAPIFKVKKSGQAIEYIGRMVKRPAPTADDYITIEPGEVVSAMLDLAEGYAIYDVGSYLITYDADLAILGGPNAKAYGVGAASSVSAAATLVLSEDRPLPLSPMAKEATFTGCTGSQQGTINSAFASAQQIANEAASTLTSTPTNQRSTAPRYVRWFGTYTQSRYATVESNFRAISNALYDGDITFDCSCNDNFYAYVYANRPYEIYLCNVFWSAPRLGIDSQAGTIVHEISHFTNVAGTDDYAYGQDSAINLASRYPSLAIDNADSYLYFAENTPPLSMDAGDGGNTDGGSSIGNGSSTGSGSSTDSGNSSRCSNSAKLRIHKAYIGYYARCGEFEGFEYWCTRLDAEGGDLGSIIAAFGTSQEYTDRFSGLSDSELINNLYRNMFNRDAEPGPSGMGFYLGLLESRRQEWRNSHGGSNEGATEYALSRIALDVSDGAQGNDALTLNGKISACPQY
ncbi:M35 family metallo-endopeptidase [Candidatus Thiosymbion oneisti]|uniref:M35 family metallo-endopeptidase n=1 Tax=Candidatus Thiosymbion oneisti TaxID=589554 RepID=UPI000B7F9064|nr:M35 family metallo-endopeptidase [Candidatus Thiosymbion oneisti]